MMIPKINTYITLVVLLIASIQVTAQVPFQCKGQYYASLSPELHGPSNLYEVIIDPNTNLAVFDAIKINVGKNVNAIGYRSVDNLIYGVDPNDFFLYQLDANGQVFELTKLPLTNNLEYFAGDVSPDGRYLILIGGGGFTGLDSEMIKVDLESPTYNITRIQLNTNTRIFDIAFDPVDGTLYGLDSNFKRLVKINATNGVMTLNFPQQPLVNSIGALFFDAFGDLFAYGGVINQVNQDKLFEVNKVTGGIAVLTTGPIAQGNDGCSCPYTIKLEKTVNPKSTFPCETVRYTFSIVNSSGAVRSGIDLTDVLPLGFEFVEVLINPYGGDDSQSAGRNISITDMQIYPGEDSIIVACYINDIPSGIYKNQARLVNLPPELGSFTLSDNPATFIKEDSTDIEIVDLNLDFIEESYIKCEGEDLVIDATIEGADIYWNGVLSDPVQVITGPGNYTIEARNNCGGITIFISVFEETISISTALDYYEIDLGDIISMDVNVITNSANYDVLWSDLYATVLDCHTCDIVTGMPLFDTTFDIIATSEGGCKDQTTIRVEVNKVRDVFYPNIFSPNGDGVNDLFFLEGLNNVTIRNFFIYDRWGNLVHNHYAGVLGEVSTSWNGTYNGELVNPGVYVWYAELVWLDGYVEKIAGDITVVR